MARKTRSGGAAMKISASTVSCWGVMLAVAMSSPEILEFPPSFAKNAKEGWDTRFGSALDKLLQLCDDAGPTAAVVLAGDGFLRQAAVGQLYLRTARFGRQFPADYGAARLLVVPVRDP